MNQNKKIIDYTLVFTIRAEQLPVQVKLVIEEGFEPFGNVFKDEDDYFCQVMVKYEGD